MSGSKKEYLDIDQRKMVKVVLAFLKLPKKAGKGG
jgi:hypothetical protein